MTENRFATAINCMDGRVQLPVIEYLKDQYNVHYVDMITEAGPDGLMCSGDTVACDSIRKRVLISVEKHGSKLLAIVAHEDCAGNPVSKPVHMTHVKEALALIESWNLPVETIGLWVDSSGNVSAVK
jgi:hypothetical protein